MKFVSLAAVVVLYQVTVSLASNLVCFYDANGYEKEGLGKINIEDLDTALQFCTHLIYGYAGLRADNYELTTINSNLDVRQRHFATITALKDKYPQVKILLSVGGDKDLENPEKYVNLLESGRRRQNQFIESALDYVLKFNFDGLDLAFQFPRNKPRKVHSGLGSAWKGLKKLFTGDFVVDEKANEHKEEFTDLVSDLKRALERNNRLLSLTVLPNVNSSWYFNVPSVINNLDFVNLAAFDFLTPERNPEEADFTSPLYEPPEQSRMGHYNVDFQVQHWLSQRVPAHKINLGVAAYGRAWKMTEDSGYTGLPVVADTEGVAPAGPQTQKAGLLNWAEICMKLPNERNANGKGADAALRRIRDPTKRFGQYAFRTANGNDENGVWVSYEDPETASLKAAYAKEKNLGGVALFDLTLDDFRGQCTGDKYPILRAIKYRLS